MKECEESESVEDIDETPKPACMCKFEGCSVMLRSSNKTGFCSIHVGRANGDRNPEALMVSKTLEKYERIKAVPAPPAPQRTNQSFKLADARERTPPAPPSAVEKLRAAVFESISVDDVKDLMEGLVKRAKDGDMAATKVLLGYISAGAGQRPVQQVVMLQNNPASPASSGQGDA